MTSSPAFWRAVAAAAAVGVIGIAAAVLMTGERQALRDAENRQHAQALKAQEELSAEWPTRGPVTANPEPWDGKSDPCGPLVPPLKARSSEREVA